MAACSICGTFPFVVPLSCGCSSFCQECILSWCKEQLNGQSISEDRPIVCPTGDARHEISLEEVLEIAKGSTDELPISQTTLRMSLRQLPSTVFCPKEGCDYIGWIDTNKKCSDPVECELCGEKWREVQLLPAWRRYAQLCAGLFTGEDETFSILWKDIWTKACPGCGVHIEKNGGCPNMNCFRCNLAFCWTCMKPNRTHDTDYCSTRMLIWILIYTLFIVVLIVKVLSICEVLLAVMTGITIIGMMVAVLGLGMGILILSIVQAYDELWVRLLYIGLYVAGHVLLVLFTDLGREIWYMETTAAIAIMHSAIAMVFLKY